MVCHGHCSRPKGLYHNRQLSMLEPDINERFEGSRIRSRQQSLLTRTFRHCLRFVLVFFGFGTSSFSIAAQPGIEDWLLSSREQIAIERENTNNLNRKLSELTSEYERNIRERKRLYIAIFNKETEFSDDEIRVIVRENESIRSRVVELELMLLETERESQVAQRKVERLERIMKRAIADREKIKNNSTRKIKRLVSKTRSKFDRILDSKTRNSKINQNDRNQMGRTSRLAELLSEPVPNSRTERAKSSSRRKLIRVKAAPEPKKPQPSKTRSPAAGLLKKEKYRPKKEKSLKARTLPKPVKAEKKAISELKEVDQEANRLMIDDFNSSERKNSLGNRSNTYQMAPSSSVIDFVTDKVDGIRSGVLKLQFDKKNKGGPHWQGGWCGYYTITRDEKTDS